MKKSIIFDFDKTLTLKDTNFSFFIFNGRKKSFFIIRIIIYIFFRFLCKIKLVTNLQLKNVGLMLFYRNVNEKNFLKISKKFAQTIELNNNLNIVLQKYKKMDYDVIISSASFEYYINYLYPDIKVIGTTLNFNNGKVKIKNHNYKSEKKNNLLKCGYNSIDILYTDSKSDIHIAKISKEINLVVNENIIKCNSVEHYLSL